MRTQHLKHLGHGWFLCMNNSLDNRLQNHSTIRIAFRRGLSLTRSQYPMQSCFLLWLRKILLKTRAPPPPAKKLPWWYKPDLSCVFHQGAHDHDVERCLVLKSEVQRLIRDNILSFKDLNPNCASFQTIRQEAPPKSRNVNKEVHPYDY
jgi:hypothetical protein